MTTKINEAGLGVLVMGPKLKDFWSVQSTVATLAFCLIAIGLSLSVAEGSGIVAEVSNRDSAGSQSPAAAPPTMKTKPRAARGPQRVNFKRERVSIAARQVANWVVDSRDNQRLPFAIIDKVQAKVFVFDADGLLRGAAPVLLGSAYGDNSVPGIGDRKLSSIRPEERTTPAGRFLASLGRNSNGEEILWVDYAAAISLHRVITTNPKEHRLERLATSKLFDKRISYGCINVPANFFDNVVRQAFTGTNGIVYVLPDTWLLKDVFGLYDVEEHPLPHIVRKASGR